MIFENYYLYRVAIWLVERLPSGFVYFVAGLVAEVNFFFNTRSRRGVYANQARVLPRDAGAFRRWRLARGVFRHFACSVMDFFRVPRVNAGNLAGYMAEFRGLEHVEAARASGKSGIFVTAHMGSWELGGACLGLKGIPLTVPALSHDDPRIDAIFQSTRAASGMEVVALGGALARLEDALRRGRFVGLISDRDVTRRGPVLPFFGEPTHVPDGHARLALRTGAWILPLAIHRLPDMRIVIEVRPPIIADPAVDTRETLTRRTLLVLEEFIRAHPEQWLSFFDLWSADEAPVR